MSNITNKIIIFLIILLSTNAHAFLDPYQNISMFCAKTGNIEDMSKCIEDQNLAFERIAAHHGVAIGEMDTLPPTAWTAEHKALSICFMQNYKDGLKDFVGMEDCINKQLKGHEND